MSDTPPPPPRASAPPPVRVPTPPAAAAAAPAAPAPPVVLAPLPGVAPAPGVGLLPLFDEAAQTHDAAKKYLLYAIDSERINEPSLDTYESKYLKYGNAESIPLEEIFFYKKYLLYKQKYLQLKKLLN